MGFQTDNMLVDALNLTWFCCFEAFVFQNEAFRWPEAVSSESLETLLGEPTSQWLS